MSDLRVGLCTCPDAATAERIAALLVDDRHAACVNILPGVLSVYRWQGELCRDAEVLLLVKTTQAAWAGLEQALATAHPYDCPELVALPVVGGLPDYLNWLRTSLAP